MVVAGTIMAPGSEQKKRKHKDKDPGGSKKSKTPGFKVDEGFDLVAANSLIDAKAIKSGKQELWLVQLPLSVPLDQLNGGTLDVTPHASGSITGVADLRGGGRHLVKEEPAVLARQLRVFTPSEAKKGRLEMLPVDRRLTLSVVAAAPTGESPASPATTRANTEEPRTPIPPTPVPDSATKKSGKKSEKKSGKKSGEKSAKKSEKKGDKKEKDKHQQKEAKSVEKKRKQENPTPGKEKKKKKAKK